MRPSSPTPVFSRDHLVPPRDGVLIPSDKSLQRHVQGVADLRELRQVQPTFPCLIFADVTLRVAHASGHLALAQARVRAHLTQDRLHREPPLENPCRNHALLYKSLAPEPSKGLR